MTKRLIILLSIIMAKIIRAIIVLVWLGITALLAYIMYSVLQTEPDRNIVFAWIVMSVIAFSSATFLAYNVMYPHKSAYSEESDEEYEDDEDSEED